jgi:hypothetical protein
MNLIGLDISKISTAMAIEVDNKEFLFSYNTNSKDYKWNKLVNKIVNVKTYNYSNDKNIEYSDSEIDKLQQFINISNDIIKDIKFVINENEKTIIFIEGYSYSKNVGPIIDLVGIGTIIRSKLLENIKNIEKMFIISPKSLKSYTCEMIYGFEILTKKNKKTEKIINLNKNGVKGGDFSKHDMLEAILDSKKNYTLLNIINQNYEEIKNAKNMPKPIEDINDAWLIKEIIKYIK